MIIRATFLGAAVSAAALLGLAGCSSSAKPSTQVQSPAGSTVAHSGGAATTTTTLPGGNGVSY